MSVLALEQRAFIVQHLVEGGGVRATSRLTGVNKSTVNKLLLDAGVGCQILHDELFRDLTVSRVEVTVQSSFVQKRECESWLYVARDTMTRAALAYRVGSPGEGREMVARALTWDLNRRVDGSFDVVGDSSLRIAVRDVLGPGVRFFEGGTAAGDRSKLSHRTDQVRLTRCTLKHSKKVDHHMAAAALYYGYFNFCRVHEALKTTPAVALGLALTVWDTVDLVDAAFAARTRQTVAEPDVEP